MTDYGMAPGPLPGCGCVWIEHDVVDTTECTIHPLECEALHPETGRNCHHSPGHTGQHAYMDCYVWPNEASA